jgi:hypothetical protein
MSQIVKRVFRFLPSPSPDVVGYVLFHAPEGAVLDYSAAKVDLGVPETVDANGKFVVSLNDLPDIAALPEGKYQLGVASKDDVGNLSDIKSVTTPLDLEPPAAVEGVEVTEA